MNNSFLLPGWAFRPPHHDDLLSVAALIAACDEADFGAADTTMDDLQAEWQRPGFDLSTNAWLLLAPDGRFAGYTDFFLRPDEVYISHNTCLHPAFRDQVNIVFFYRLGEEIARGHFTGKPGVLRTVSLLEERGALLESDGYHSTHVHWRMEIELDAPPPAPVWPDGFRLRPFDLTRDAHSVHETIQVAFRDLNNHPDQPFEDWKQFMLNRTDFDPALVLVAEKDSQISGVAACFDYPTGGWVRQLAVKKEYRGRGLGMALLRQAFGEFYRRGKGSTGLVVDSQNPTGAPQFYLGAGMHPAAKIVTYQKPVQD